MQAVGAVQQADQKIIRPEARRIVQSADRGSAEVETVGRADKIEGQDGRSFDQVFAAFFAPSPLGLVIWPLLLRVRAIWKNGRKV